MAGEYKWVGRKPSGGGRGGRMCGRARQVLAGGREDDQVLGGGGVIRCWIRNWVRGVGDCFTAGR